MAKNTVSRVEFENTTETEKARKQKILDDARPRIGPANPRNVPLSDRASTAEALISKLPSGGSRDLARMATHGLARTGNMILRLADIPNRVFGNTRSRLQDLYEASERGLAHDAYEDRSGIPQIGETAVTYGPNGRDVVSVDFVKDGVPYRAEVAKSGVHGAIPRILGSVTDGLGLDRQTLVRPSIRTGWGNFSGIGEFRLTRHPDSQSPEVVESAGWDEDLGGFVRTIGNRRWRMSIGEVERLAREQDLYEAWLNDPASMAEGPPVEPAPAKLVIEERQPDGTWVPVETSNTQTSPPRANTLPPPPDEIPMWAQQGLTEEALREEAEYNEAMERTLAEEERGRRFNMGDDVDGDVPFALKAGRTRRNVRAAEGAGDTKGAPETTVSKTPVSEAPARQGGPRIVLNPAVFHDKRDGLCVAMNEAFRILMEMMDFEPVSEPTDAQRRFFAETAYANDELQLRRTIIARICTLDTSIS